MSKKPQPPSPLEFKSSTFSVPVLYLASNDVHAIEQALLDKISISPEFFRDSPVILDISELDKQLIDISLIDAINLVRNSGLIPVGIRSTNEHHTRQALELRIPVYSAISEPKKTRVNTPEPVKEVVATRFISQPVRSGQRVYAEGDLVIMSTVSAGSEIISEGSIHVYGILRGRALAGVQGNTEARIFCLDLRAELISIAGNYKLIDDIKIPVPGKPAQVYLQDNSLIIKNL
jgi:septum site-determining protein MinC